MGTIADKTNYLKTTKAQIRKAIEDKGVTISDTDTFRDYATRIEEIPSSGRDIEDYLNSPFVSGRSYVGNFKEIPNIDTSAMTSMSNMFSECTSLTTIPLLDTSAVTGMDYMFYQCTSLTTIPLLDTSKATGMNSMFYNCSSLTTIPQLDTSAVTDMDYMFYQCTSLTSIPQLDTSKVTNMYNMFYRCSALTTLGGLLNLGQAYSTSQSASFLYYSFVLSSCTALTHDSLMNVINNLYDIKTKGCNAQNLTLGSTNLAKLTSEEIAIATNKGWTVS